jgi:hypothetical protein
VCADGFGEHIRVHLRNLILFVYYIISLSFHFRLESDLLAQESKIVETENKTQVLNASIHR